MTNTLVASKHGFPILKQLRGVSNDEDLKLLLRKGIYPYEFVTSIEKLRETTTLPPREAFFSRLKDEEVSEEDYEHAQNVWQRFKCQNMLDYTMIYNKTDTYLLAESIINFRNWIHDEFQLDMAQYLSLPMLGKDIMLSTTKAEPELLSDPEMIHLLKSNIRGGVSYINTRMVDVTKTKGSLTYLDANNLYGKAMTYPMPYGDYQWMNPEQLQEFEDKVKINPMEEEEEEGEEKHGHILEVDLEYPDHLHERHGSFPLAPEQVEITEDMLSPYSQECLRQLSGKTKYRAKKLTATFNTRKNYLVHEKNLRLYLHLGMVLKKIHRGIRFIEKPFIEPYINFCMERRRQAKTTAESDNLKLLSNSVFGKVKKF